MSAEPSASTVPGQAIISPLREPEWPSSEDSHSPYGELESPFSNETPWTARGPAHQPFLTEADADATEWEDPVEDRFEGYDPGMESEDDGPYEADHDSGELEE